MSDDDQVWLVVHGRRQMEHLQPGNDTYAAAGTYTDGWNRSTSTTRNVTVV